MPVVSFRPFFKLMFSAMLVLFCFQAKAGHVSSNEITYRWIDTLTYEVTFTFYRTCAGTALSNPSSATRVVCKTSGSNVGLSLTLVSMKELKTVCDTLSGQCSGKNQTRSGDGIEIHVYRDTVDFRTSKYNGLIKSGCTDLRFEVGLCCRNSSITTGSAGYLLYNFADLSLDDGIQNSSPEFAFEPVPRFYCNQPVYYSFAAIDTVDGDSLSYDIVQPMSSSTSTISANMPPFTVYYPGSLKYPYSNPNANPPIGFYFDKETGSVIFTPTKCDEITTMVFQVTEWRKDTAGKYQKIGVVRRDMMYEVKYGQGNNAPYLSSARSFTICEGDSLSIIFTSGDDVKVPPPPLPKPDPDSTKMRWNYGIPGAHFSIIDSNVLRQRGRFSWRPEIGQSRSLPYQFDIAIRDNSCPYFATSYYPIQVKVHPRAHAEIQIDSLTCGRFVVTSLIDSAKTKFPKYFWEVLDTNGKVLSHAKAPEFASSQSFISVKQKDTIRFQQKGRYIIRHRIDNIQRCPSYSFDTIDIPDLLEVAYTSESDTFVCQGTAKSFTADVTNGSSLVAYLWSTGDTTQQTSFSLPDSIAIGELSIIVTDTNGCYATSKVQALNRPRPTIDPITDIIICKGDSIEIKPQGQLAFWDDPRDSDTTLYQQGATLEFSLYDKNKFINSDTVFEFKIASLYNIVVSDSLGCTDTTTFNVKWPKGKGLKNMSLCNIKGTTIDLRQFEDAKDSGGIWYCPAYKKTVKNERTLLLDSFDVTDYSVTNSIYFSYKHLGNGCELLDSFKATVHPLPQLKLQDITVCQSNNSLDVIEDSVIISPNESVLRKGRQTWSCLDCKTYTQSNVIQDTGTGKPGANQYFQIYIDPFTIPLKPNGQESLTFDMEFKDENGCYAKDTTTIVIKKEVKIDFSGFPNLCWDEGIVDLKVLSQVSPVDGSWKAIDKTGYATADYLNRALSSKSNAGDTLVTTNTVRPAEFAYFKYYMRYSHNASGCLATRDTFLTIRGLPEPRIYRKVLSINSQTQPYSFCTSQSDLTLDVRHQGGVWSSGDPATLVGNVFKPSKSTKVNFPFKVYYDYSDIYGCRGSDSVEVVVESPNALSVSPKDTVHSWYADNMVQWVSANPRFGYGVKWEALDGGSFENDTAKTTRFTFQTDKEVTSKVRVKATANQAYNACGAETNDITILVHRTPCIDFEMDLDLSTKLLKLTPVIDSFPQYQWTVLSATSFDVTPTFDVSGVTDTLVNVRLNSYNKGGDNCYTDKRINLKNGSIKLIDDHHIRIYPNPVLDGFNIDVDGDKKIDQLTIYNSVGSEVTQPKWQDHYVDCSALPSGVYTVLIEMDEKRFVTKFVKQ